MFGGMHRRKVLWSFDLGSGVYTGFAFETGLGIGGWGNGNRCFFIGGVLLHFPHFPVGWHGCAKMGRFENGGGRNRAMT